MQAVFETSLAELLRPNGYIRLGLTCVTGLLGADLVSQDRHEDLSDLVSFSLLLGHHPQAMRHSLDADTGAVQAAIYFFTLASTEMVSIGECDQELHIHISLHQLGISEALQAALQLLKPYLAASRAMVLSRSYQTTPQAVLPHMWPAFLQTMCSGREPVTQVRAAATKKAPHGLVAIKP